MSLQACEPGGTTGDAPASQDNPPMVVTMAASTTSDDAWHVVWTHTASDNEHTETADIGPGDRDWTTRRLIKGGDTLTMTAYGSPTQIYGCTMKSASADIIEPNEGGGQVTCQFRYPSRRDG